jgi:hypothetical protein
VEICEKLRRPGGEATQRKVQQGEVYSISEAAASVEMRACSACAGDYEDPDRTAWSPDDAEDGEPGSAPRETTIEFPDEDR